MVDLKIGIIGCGALGKIHARRFAAIPGVRVTALSDPVPAAIERVVGDLPESPLCRTTDDRELLTADLDVVCIASPDSYHVGQVLDALKSGLHVLCEKPLTPSEAELDHVIRARDAATKQIALTYPRRYDASIREMREEILSGRHGEVRTITAYNAEDWITPNKGTWRHDPEITPGGFFYDASGHQLDTICWVTGLEAATVRAKYDLCGSPVPLKMWGWAEMSNGAPLTFCFVGDAHLWREQINIHCDRTDFALLNGKAYRVGGKEASVDMPTPDYRLAAPDTGKLVPLGAGQEDETADACFIRILREGGPNWSPLEDVRPVIRLTRAALGSAEQDGATIKV